MCCSATTSYERSRAYSKEKLKEMRESLEGLALGDSVVPIHGEARMQTVLRSYNRFLETLENEDNRNHLKKLSKSKRTDLEFWAIKNEGHHFNRAMLQLFEDTFDPTHPIHRAVVF